MLLSLFSEHFSKNFKEGEVKEGIGEDRGEEEESTQTSLGQSKNMTNFISAVSPITLYQPSRLSLLRGKPSIRNFFTSEFSISCFRQTTCKYNYSDRMKLPRCISLGALCMHTADKILYCTYMYLSMQISSFKWVGVV